MRTPVPTASTRDDRNAVRVPASTVRTLSHSNWRARPRAASASSVSSAACAAARASASDTSRSAALTSGTSAAAMLSSVTPRPASRTAAAGSPASSPHTPTQRPWAWRPRDRGLHQSQHRRLGSGEQRGQPGVAALGGHRVLGEVVGAQGEEVDVGGQARRRERRRRDLHHDPELHGGVDPGVRPRLIEQLARGGDLGQRGDHRQHRLDRVLGGDAQDGAELRGQHARGGPAPAGCRAPRGTGCPPAASAAPGSGLSAPASRVRTISGRPSSATAISRSVSACSSSPGSSSRPRNRNSVRSRPTPSAPSCNGVRRVAAGAEVGEDLDRARHRA